jgi:hypothetical protein
MPKCDKCLELATKGTFNMIERARAPGEWREFRDAGPIMNGCDHHPPVSFLTYLDGRVIRTAQAVPEKVPEA